MANTFCEVRPSGRLLQPHANDSGVNMKHLCMRCGPSREARTVAWMAPEYKFVWAGARVCACVCCV